MPWERQLAQEKERAAWSQWMGPADQRMGTRIQLPGVLPLRVVSLTERGPKTSHFLSFFIPRALPDLAFSP